MLAIPYITGSIVSYPPGATFGPRTLGDYEFVWIIRGNVLWEADGRRFDAPPGTLILSRPGFRERYRWDPLEPTRHGYLHFDLPARLPGDWPARARWPLIQKTGERDILRPLLAYIIEVAGLERRRPEPTLKRALETLLSAFVQGPAKTLPGDAPEVPTAVHAAVAMAARRLRDDHAATITLDDLAQAGGVSAKHLCRLFSEHLRQSPMQVLLALRMQHAMQLLGRTDLKLERIAQACGFATPFHFSRRFKQFFGMPPRAMRREIAAGRYPLTRHLRFADRLAVEYPQ